MVKHYVENGLDKKYLRDPDNGANIMKKKADLGLLDKKSLKQMENFQKKVSTLISMLSLKYHLEPSGVT